MTPPIAEPTRMPARAGSTPSTPASAHASPRGRDGEHDVPLEPARVLRADDRDRVEVLHLGGDANGVAGRVERADPVHAARPGDGRLPRRARVVAERRDGSETGDGDAAHEGSEPIARLVAQSHKVGSGHGASAVTTRSRNEPVERPADLDHAVPFPPMEAELVRELPEPDGWQYEPKWDGFRGLLENTTGELRLWSRNARPLLRYFPELRPLDKLLPPTSALDGEIVISRDGVLDFDAMQTRLHPAESRVNKLAGGDPRRVHRLRRARLEGRGDLAEAAHRAAEGARAEGEALPPLARDPRPRRGARLARPVRGDRARRRHREARRRRRTSRARATASSR